MKLLKLALANIRKSRSATVSLFIFVMVAVLLLNIGLMVITQINPFIDEKVDEVNDPHALFFTDKESYTPKYEEFLNNYPGVTETEVEEIISIPVAKFMFDDTEQSWSIFILNADGKRTFGSLNLVEKLDTLSSDDIFAPYSFKTNGGYELGDTFTITYQNKEFEYRIAGFFESPMMGMPNMGIYKFMLPNDSYEALASELGEQEEGILISTAMEDRSKSIQLSEDFLNEAQRIVPEKAGNIYWLDIEIVKNVSAMIVSLISTVLVTFSVMIVFVSLIVIRFRVSNTIDDGMTNIGVLKAIGYTSGQVFSSIIIQFLLITLCASVIGIALYYALMPLIGKVLTLLTGLIWVQRFDMLINFVSISLVAFSVVIVTVVSAFRVRKIFPVDALRDGIQTHSFRKNYFPLEKSRGRLHFLLGLKSIFTSVKQQIMLFIIITILSFASIFSMVLYYNIVNDKTAFLNLFGVEQADVLVAIDSEENSREIMQSIEGIDDVLKVNIFDSIELKVDGIEVRTTITEDFSDLNNNVVFDGRQPKYDNEISISWMVAEQLDKEIGDTVEVEFQGNTESFLITGLSQTVNNLGKIAGITTEGIERFLPDYNPFILYVYLDEISVKEFIKIIQNQYGDRIFEVLDIEENIEGQIGMYTAAVFMIALMVLSITVIVVVLILYLVVQTIIIKRRKDFGVLKALGFSARQLMNQISFSFLPVTISSVVVGGLCGFFLTNPMLTMLFGAAGIKKLEFIINGPLILGICLAIFLLTYIVSFFAARKIKNISAYHLITE